MDHDATDSADFDLAWLFAAFSVAAQQSPPTDPPLSNTQAEAPVQNADSQARFYTNRSLFGTYRVRYIPGPGGGLVTYDGQGHFEGYNEYSRFDGTYSVNPDGTGIATTFVRASVGYGGVASGFEPLLVPLKYSGPFKIHPSGAIEFETSGPIGRSIGPQVKTLGTLHRVDDGS